MLVESLRFSGGIGSHGGLVTDLADQELMDMGVAPAHAELDHIVELGQGVCSRP